MKNAEERTADRMQAAATIKKMLQQGETGAQDVIAMALAELFQGQQELRDEIAGLTEAVTGATEAMKTWGHQIEKWRLDEKDRADRRRSFT